MNLREQREHLEKKILQPRAAFSSQSQGRDREEEECPVRTVYQRDRDRIIHSKAFRRLKHKTQVFISPEGDHYRTRLTHTLEVAQVARTAARALCLNEDLTEAIALGHDLGHTPFGHSGEEALDEIYAPGFKHNRQSLRVVEILEDGRGLNLTREVRDGILKHTGEDTPLTLEGQVVKISDRIAYINHDIDDALRAGILTMDRLPGGAVKVLGDNSSRRIDTLVKDLISNSQGKGVVCLSRPLEDILTGLRTFMFSQVYLNSQAKKEEEKIRVLLARLFEHFCRHPEDIKGEKKAGQGEDPERMACDYIAGMTDRYIVKLYQDLFVPRSWSRW